MDKLNNSVWRTNPDFLISCKKYGEQYAVYHSGTGDTHLIDTNAFAILERIQSQPVYFKQLLNEFADLADNQQVLSEYLRNLLSEWQKVGLIECEIEVDSI